MARHGLDMAVVEMDTIGLGVKLIDEDAIVAHGFDPIHIGGMIAVEVEGMGMARLVVEDDADAIAFRRPKGRPRHPAIQVPGDKLGRLVELNLPALGLDSKLPDGATILLGDGAIVEVPQGLEGDRALVGGGSDRLGGGGSWRFLRAGTASKAQTSGAQEPPL